MGGGEEVEEDLADVSRCNGGSTEWSSCEEVLEVLVCFKCSMTRIRKYETGRGVHLTYALS